MGITDDGRHRFGVSALFSVISSMFRCAMNLSLIWKAGRSLLMMPSMSALIESPTNMYFM